MDIGNKMDKPETVVAMSKGPFYHAIYILINFSKGFFIPYLAESVLMLEAGMLSATILCAFIAHLWSPFRKFKQDTSFFWFILGVYVFMSPQFLYIFPLFYIISALILNSFPFGYLVAISGMLFAIWLSELPLYLLPTNVGVFLILLFALRSYLSDEIEAGKTWTIQSSFHNR